MNDGPSESIEQRLADAVERVERDLLAAFAAAYAAGAHPESVGHQLGRQEHFQGLRSRYGDLRAAQGRWTEHLHTSDCMVDCDMLAEVQMLLKEGPMNTRSTT